MPAYTDTMQQMMPRSLGAASPASMPGMPNPFEGGALPLNQNYSSTMQSSQGVSGPGTVTGAAAGTDAARTSAADPDTPADPDPDRSGHTGTDGDSDAGADHHAAPDADVRLVDLPRLPPHALADLVVGCEHLVQRHLCDLRR